MKAAVLTDYKRICWQDVAKPTIAPQDILIKVNYACICGSDEHIFNGDFHPRTQLPLIPGHEFTGQVAAIGKEVSGYTIGDQVVVDPIIWCGQCPACLRGHYPACTSLKLIGIDLDGGFGEYVAVKQDMVYHIPANIAARHAALVEVLAIGFHACMRAQVSSHDSLAIFGAGKVGQSILQAARTISQQTIYMVDILPERLKIAEDNYDNIITINAQEKNPAAVIKAHSQGKGVDIAFEAIGHAQAISGQLNPVREAVQSIRGGGTVCVLGLSDHPVDLVMKELIWKEGRLVSSRVSHGEFSTVIDALSRNKLKPESMISAEIPISESQKAFELLKKQPESYLKILLTF